MADHAEGFVKDGALYIYLADGESRVGVSSNVDFPDCFDLRLETYDGAGKRYTLEQEIPCIEVGALKALGHAAETLLKWSEGELPEKLTVQVIREDMVPAKRGKTLMEVFAEELDGED
jgi:hypothetical protein